MKISSGLTMKNNKFFHHLLLLKVYIFLSISCPSLNFPDLIVSEVIHENCPFFRPFSREFPVSLSRRASSPFGWWTSCPVTLCVRTSETVCDIWRINGLHQHLGENERCSAVAWKSSVLGWRWAPRHYLDRNTVPGHGEHIFRVEVTLTIQRRKNPSHWEGTKINQSKKQHYQDELHVQTTVISLYLLWHIVCFNHTFS